MLEVTCWLYFDFPDDGVGRPAIIPVAVRSGVPSSGAESQLDLVSKPWIWYMSLHFPGAAVTVVPYCSLSECRESSYTEIDHGRRFFFHINKHDYNVLLKKNTT